MPRKGNNLILGRDETGQPIILSHEHRLQHGSVVGQTGSGKSRYVEGLIRQDIRSHPKTGSGILCIDAHGGLVDGLVGFLCANRLTHLPVTVIDLRRNDRLVPYNPLRRRTGEPAVIIANFVKALAYIWGASGTDQTPLFERWAINTLFQLYGEGKTLADAAPLFTPDGDVAIERITDPMIRRDWVVAKRNWKNFERDTLSAVNRFRRFLINPLMRAIFGQTSVSLDLGRALDEGHIILVSLGRTHGNVSQEDADLLATLLVSDFWMAVEERGKSDHHRPFYLYLDEFQRFVTPAMAESLAEARGFGIGMFLSNQFPRQVYNAGPHGPKIYDEIRENTRTKVVFRQRSVDNMQIVADEVFFATYDPMRIKYHHHSTKVLNYDLKYLPSVGRSATATVGGGTQRSHSVGSNHSVGTNWSHTDTVGWSVTQSATDTVSESASVTDQWSNSAGETESSVRSGGTAIGDSKSRGGATNKSESETVGLSGTDIFSEAAQRKNKRFYDHADGENVKQSWNLGRSAGSSESATAGAFSTQSAGWNEAMSRNKNAARGGGKTASLSASHAKGLAVTESESSADSFGGNETFGSSESDTAGESTSWSNAQGQNILWSPNLMPQIGKEADAPVYWTLDEQRFLAMRQIFILQDREAYVLAGDMVAPALIRTPDVNRPDICRVVVDLAVGWYQQESGLTLPLDAAIKQVRDRDREWDGSGALADADADFATVTT
jgi:hypothetical protein